MPVFAESLAVPLDHGCRFDENNHLQTTRQNSVEPTPEQAVATPKPRSAGALPMENGRRKVSIRAKNRRIIAVPPHCAAVWVRGPVGPENLCNRQTPWRRATVLEVKLGASSAQPTKGV